MKKFEINDRVTLTAPGPWKKVTNPDRSAKGVNYPLYGQTYTVNRTFDHEGQQFIAFSEIANPEFAIDGREPLFDAQHFSLAILAPAEGHA